MNIDAGHPKTRLTPRRFVFFLVRRSGGGRRSRPALRSLTSYLLTRKPGDTVNIGYADAFGAGEAVSVRLASGPPQ